MPSAPAEATGPHEAEGAGGVAPSLFALAAKVADVHDEDGASS